MSDQQRDTVPSPGNHEQSSDETPDAADLEISRAEEVEMTRQLQVGFEGFEQGMQG